MHFTFRQLEIFVAAAEDENFRVTADRLGITQPAVSKHIAALELKAGGRLFSRNRGSIARLSPLGRELLDQARAMLREADLVRNRAAERAEDRALLRVVAGPYITDHLLRPAMTRYHMLENAAELELLAAPTAREMLRMIRNGAADVGLYTGPAIDDPDFVIERMREVQVGLFAARDLARRIDSYGALDHVPIVLAPAHSPAELWLRESLAKAGITPRNIVGRSQFAEVIRDLVLDGVGMGMMFGDEAAEHVASGRIVQLPISFEMGYRCIAYQRRPLDRATERAIQFLRSILR